MNEMWEGALFTPGQFGERIWWMSLQPSNILLGPVGSRSEQGGGLGADGWIEHNACARTIERLRPCQRWAGSFMDEALGSELTPNALEDGGRIGIRAPVLQPHAANSFATIGVSSSTGATSAVTPN